MKAQGDTKVCSRCQQRKSTSCFHRNRRMNDGFHHYCKLCNRSLRLKYRLLNVKRDAALTAIRKLARMNKPVECRLDALQEIAQEAQLQVAELQQASRPITRFEHELLGDA